MLGLNLPLRPMTADEAAGFRMALGTLSTWGRQIQAYATADNRAHAEFMVSCCAALDRRADRLTQSPSPGSVQGGHALPMGLTARADGTAAAPPAEPGTL